MELSVAEDNKFKEYNCVLRIKKFYEVHRVLDYNLTNADEIAKYIKEYKSMEYIISERMPEIIQPIVYDNLFNHNISSDDDDHGLSDDDHDLAENDVCTCDYSSDDDHDLANNDRCLDENDVCACDYSSDDECEIDKKKDYKRILSIKESSKLLSILDEKYHKYLHIVKI